MRRASKAIAMVVVVCLVAFFLFVPIAPMATTQNRCISIPPCPQTWTYYESVSFYFFRIGAIYNGCGRAINLYQFINDIGMPVNTCASL